MNRIQRCFELIKLLCKTSRVKYCSLQLLNFVPLPSFMHKHKDTVALEYCNCRSIDSILKP